MELDQTTISQVAGVQNAFLSLPRGKRFSAIRDAIRSIARLVDAQGGWVGCFVDGELIFINENVGPQIARYVQSQFEGVDEDGYFLFADPELERVSRLRREMGSGIYADYEIYTDETRELPQFQEIWGAANAEYVLGMSCRMPVGDSVLGLTFGSPEHPRYRDPETKELLRLIQPAFEAAFRQLFDEGLSRRHYVALVEALPFPAFIRAHDGSVVARSPSTADASVDAKEGDNAIRLLGPNLPGLRSSEMVFFPGEGASNLKALARAAGLSERRAEVAAALAMGESNKQIARRLDISPNTVRHHCEAVFDQLGVSSRGGVMLALMNSNPDPQ